MTNFKKIFIIFFLFIIFSVNANAKNFIGVIGFAVGEIENQNSEKLNNGSKIYFGDTIIVNKQSNAQVLLLDETILTVGESSEVTIDEFIYDPKSKSGKIVSNILTGTVKILTGNISKNNPDDLEIKMPTGTLGARGTEFVVIADSYDKSTVVLLGPGPNNTLGMKPGNIEVTDGSNAIDITQPGFFSVITK
tara:strand:+ start:2322 stop:2897 length:576 start_codon:yes stop_codon:yes gene_type:complete